MCNYKILALKKMKITRNKIMYLTVCVHLFFTKIKSKY